jgi:nucleotide-binding universal stress UspA family protein
MAIPAWRRNVTYATLMVHLELGHSNAGLLGVASGLAAHFRAGLIGIVACQPMPIIYSEAYPPAEIIDQDRAQRQSEIKRAEAEFRGALQATSGPLEWRSSITPGPLSDYLVCEARSADLFITSVDHNASVFDMTRHVNISDLVLQAGRPVLVVPAAVSTLNPERIVVGWKETREARRAILDTLPLLKKAAHVTLVEIAAKEDLDGARAHLEDVVGWLKRHGVVAESFTWPSSGDDATQLNAIAEQRSADVIVAGAYGHSRLREWALGGVTRELLLHAERCTFVSH